MRTRDWITDGTIDGDTCRVDIPFADFFRAPVKGRGSSSDLPGRFARQIITRDIDAPIDKPKTQLRQETAKSIISRNQSPDVPFNLSINPYRGCEHGCVYCFARPTHAYLDLSPGIDFETQLTVKRNAAELFAKSLRSPSYRCEPIALGVNTDAYQPVEKEEGVVRSILEVALAHQQPLTIITKSRLILRDTDLLEKLAAQNLVHVAVSVTTLDNDLKRIMEPRAASPMARLEVIRALTDAGVPVGTLVAPVIPLINDQEIEEILTAVAEAGSVSAGYVLLRLPNEVLPLFVDWLKQHFPDRVKHILSRLRDMRGGQLYENEFGRRMSGRGIFADLLRQRFSLALRKSGMAHREMPSLNTSAFQVPVGRGQQMSLL